VEPVQKFTVEPAQKLKKFTATMYAFMRGNHARVMRGDYVLNTAGAASPIY